MTKRIIKKMRWFFKFRNFKYVGKNISMSLDAEIVGEKNISIGDDFSAGKSLKLQTWERYNGVALERIPSLKIGNKVSIMSNCHISCANEIIVNDGVLMGDNVFITDNFHGSSSWNELDIPPIDRSLDIRDGVYIGKNVWIGRNVCIMPGVRIGDGVVIGANSVVTHDIPERCIVAGVPACIIRKVKKNSE